LRPKLLIGTNNPGKLAEYRTLLRGIPFDIVNPRDIGITADIKETGKTFTENACLKATTLAKQTGLLTLADDSGIEVDALGGEPGVMSARYAGENATDSDRVKFLLNKMRNVPWEKRTARFRAVIAVATPEGRTYLAAGECQGYVASEPRGDNGFGYDPVFFVPELGKTMAELPPAEKHRLSHRGRAAVTAREILLCLAGG